MIQKELKDKGFPWEWVFNVDSFQGQLAELFREETEYLHSLVPYVQEMRRILSSFRS